MLVPRGYVQQVGLVAATLLSDIDDIPSRANCALIQAENEDIRWRDDGTSPTTSLGILLKAGDSFLYSGRLSSLSLIEVAATATINVAYYG